MKKSLNYWCFILLMMLFAATLSAEPEPETETFNRQQIISFKAVTHKISLLNKEYPELTELSQQFDFNKSEQVITFLQNSKAYPKIKTILKNSTIKDLNQVFTISQKVMGGLYFLNSKNDDTNQAESQFQTIRKVLVDNLTRLKTQDEASFNHQNTHLIEETEEQLAILDQQLIIVQQALDSLNAADKLFLEENSEWFKKQFSAASN